MYLRDVFASQLRALQGESGQWFLLFLYINLSIEHSLLGKNGVQMSSNVEAYLLHLQNSSFLRKRFHVSGPSFISKANEIAQKTATE